MVREEIMTSADVDDKKCEAVRNTNTISASEFGDHLAKVASDLETVEKCFMYFEFSKINAAEVSKYLVMINDLHKCTAHLADVSKRLKDGDIVINK